MLCDNLSSPMFTDLADELNREDIDDNVEEQDVMLYAVMFNGQPIYFNGSYIRFSPSPP